MKHKQTLTGMTAFAGILILVLDGKTSLLGAREGIDLCLKTVIPSLFPFLVLSILLTSSLHRADLIVMHPLRILCRLPKGTESILLSGFLGGYPVGAQSVAQAWQDGYLERKDAERMLGFCNNAGPAFLFGMIATAFANRWTPWVLWGIHIASAVLVARLSYQPVVSAPKTVPQTLSLPQVLHSALRVMATICGWVVFFRVILAFLKQWILWICPAEVQIIITGMLELSNGCCELANISSESLRFIVCSCLLAFGGLCVTMQTNAVTLGLSLRYYLHGKLLQTLFSLIFSFTVVIGIWPLTLLLVLLFLLIPQKTEKSCSIQQVAGV